MGLFWKRKSGDQFVSLKLNEPSPAAPATSTKKRKSSTTPGKNQCRNPQRSVAVALEPVVRRERSDAGSGRGGLDADSGSEAAA